MIEFSINQLVPRYILQDKNGRAMAMAIEAALRAMTNTIKTGVDIISYVDAMPEWRLDELAWEYNCLYDFSGSIEEKRKWIHQAMPIYRILGTVKAIYSYVEGIFDSVEVEEFWKYAGDPFHFRVIATGTWTDAKEAWTVRAIDIAKNVRSVLDNIAIGSKSGITVHAEGGMVSRFPYPMAGPSLLCGGDGLQ